MAEEKFYHVTPSVNGWKAEEENSDTILCEGTNKDDVLECIRHIAEKEEICHVVVHNREGEPFKDIMFNKERRSKSDKRL